MMKQLSFQIKKPCKENWDNMTGDENKRFCFNCQLHVIDFTLMPISGIMDYLKNNQGQRVCGKIYTNVPSVWLPEIQVELPGKRVSCGKFLYTFSLAAMLLGSCSPSAQDKVKDKVETEAEPETKSEILPADTITRSEGMETLKFGAPPLINAEKKSVDFDPGRASNDEGLGQEIGILLGEIEIDENDPQFLYKMPQFPGGEDSLKAYIQANLAYPEQEIQGRIIIKFTIDTFGRVMDPEVVKSIPNDEKLDKAALDLIRNMPLWIPGENRSGTKKPGLMHLPIRFTLPE